MAGPDIEPLTAFGCPPAFAQPTAPSGGGGAIVMPKACVALLPAGSVSLTVKVEVPVLVGLPDIWPFGAKERPAGSAPSVRVQVNGGWVSPEALRLVK